MKLLLGLLLVFGAGFAQADNYEETAPQIDNQEYWTEAEYNEAAALLSQGYWVCQSYGRNTRNQEFHINGRPAATRDQAMKNAVRACRAKTLMRFCRPTGPCFYHPNR